MASYYHAYKRALRYARDKASRAGVALRRFNRLSGSDGIYPNMLGPEWFAEGIRDIGSCSVWHPVGDDNIEECRRTCGEVRTFGGYVFGISVRAPKGLLET